MIKNERLQLLAESLIGISPLEWMKLKMVVDECFNRKKKEYESQLTLDSIEDIENAIQSQFG